MLKLAFQEASMLVRVATACAVALAPFAAPVASAETMPAPSAAASAHCPQMASVHVDKLPASAWAPVTFPDDQEKALRARGTDQHAPSPPSVRVFRHDPQDNHLASVVGEKTGGGWMLWTTEDKGGQVISRKDRLNPDRSRRLDAILADACFWAEPTELATQSDAACLGAMDVWIEAVTPNGRRVALQHCSTEGLTGEIAEILWNQTDIE
jgi:hypothetical protein